MRVSIVLLVIGFIIISNLSNTPPGEVGTVVLSGLVILVAYSPDIFRFIRGTIESHEAYERAAAAQAAATKEAQTQYNGAVQMAESLVNNSHVLALSDKIVSFAKTQIEDSLLSATQNEFDGSFSLYVTDSGINQREQFHVVHHSDGESEGFWITKPLINYSDYGIQVISQQESFKVYGLAMALHKILEPQLQGISFLGLDELSVCIEVRDKEEHISVPSCFKTLLISWHIRQNKFVEL